MAANQAKAHPRRQATRRAILFVSLLLFPVVLNYLSPYIIIDGATQGIITGSAVLFALLLLSSLFVGRLWCSWVCPAAGLQETVLLTIRDKPFRTGRWDWLKWVIWVPWIAFILYALLSAGGVRVDILHLTESGISVDQPMKYIVYYMVVFPILLLAIFGGRRTFCHTLCWMAPFTILGRKLRNLIHSPALRLQADSERCIDCGRCNRDCPMSLDVNQMVKRGRMEHSECILCGSCIDTCSRSVIHYRFDSGS